MKKHLSNQVGLRRAILAPQVLLFFVLLATLGPGALVAHAASDQSNARSFTLMQFTAGGHVLGFQREAVYVASADHSLKIEFLGTDGVVPMAEAASSDNTRAMPLNKVTYPNLWRGISVTYAATVSGIVKSSYLLDAGARVEQIRLRYNAPIELDAVGDLIAQFATGSMRESAPIAWQDIDGQRVAIKVAFRLIDSSIENQESKIDNALVGFAVGEYDRAYALVIDPGLTWNTFLGGSGSDIGNAIAVDGNGNVYVGGYSNVAWGFSPVRTHTSGNDAFAAKLNTDGVLQWHTFLGGSGDDAGNAIAVDRGGNVYVAGYSTATWEGSVPPVQAFTPSAYDAFAAMLDANGVLQWNTFLGGSAIENGNGIAVDRNGNVYVAGYSEATWGATPAREFAVSGSNSDGFAAKLNANGVLQWHTFLGGLGNDNSLAIAVDGGIAAANVYVTGYSAATWEDSPMRTYTSGFDAFVAKLNTTSGALQWNTFLGGSGLDDEGAAIAVDGGGNVYVGGVSNATWQEGTTPPVRAYTGSYDAFAARLDADGYLLWNTFLGGSGSDSGHGIALDTSENVYVAGYSNVTWGASPARAYTSSYDAFAGKLNSSGVLLLNAFLGGAAVDYGLGIAVDSSRNVYVVGSSDVTWGASPLRTHYTSTRDGFVAKNWAYDIYLPLIRR